MFTSTATRWTVGLLAAAAWALGSVSPAWAWAWPADGAVLRSFSLGSDAYAAGQHRGIDIALGDATTIRAPASGQVSFAGSVPTHGITVTIVTGDGSRVSLTHVGTLRVRKGAVVAEGDPIADPGTTVSRSTGCRTFISGSGSARPRPTSTHSNCFRRGLLPVLLRHPRRRPPQSPPPASAPSPVAEQPTPAAAAEPSPAPSESEPAIPAVTAESPDESAREARDASGAGLVVLGSGRRPDSTARRQATTARRTRPETGDATVLSDEAATASVVARDPMDRSTTTVVAASAGVRALGSDAQPYLDARAPRRIALRARRAPGRCLARCRRGGEQERVAPSRVPRVDHAAARAGARRRCRYHAPSREEAAPYHWRP